MDRKILFAIFVMVALISAAYSFNALSASQSTPNVEAGQDCGDFPDTISDVRLTAVVPTIQIVIDEAKAIELATKGAFVNSQLPAPNMKVQFVLYSNDTVGRSKTYNDDEADKNLLYQNVPVWIVSFCGLKIYPIAGKDTGKANPTIPYVRQEWNVVIDAMIGEIFHEFSFR